MSWNYWYCTASDAIDILDKARDFQVDGLILEFDRSEELPCSDWNLVFDDLALYDNIPELRKSGENRDRALRLRDGVNTIITEAAKRGIRVYIMAPEPEFSQYALQQLPSLLDPASDLLYSTITNRMAEIYNALPGLAGIKLYLDEGTVNLNDLDSPVTPAERMRRLISSLHQVSRDNNRTLIVSTFSLMPHQMKAITDALKAIPSSEHLVVDNYICPGDWGRIHLLNPAIGEVGGHPELISFDYCGEVWGQSIIPLCQAQFLCNSWQTVMKKNPKVVGMAGYVSWTGNAVGAPNESSIYTASRMTKESLNSPEQAVLDWASLRYGPKVAPHISSALLRTWDIVMKSWHDLGFWVQELPKSELADLAWYNYSLHWESLAIWDESFRSTEQALFHPTEETVAAVIDEKDEAVRLAEESIADIEQARPHLLALDYEELTQYFRRELIMCRVFRAYSEAFYRARMWYGGDKSQEPAIRQSLARMLALAEEVERLADPGFWTCSPERIRLCVSQIEQVLSGGTWPEVSSEQTVAAWDRQLREWGYRLPEG